MNNGPQKLSPTELNHHSVVSHGLFLIIGPTIDYRHAQEKSIVQV